MRGKENMNNITILRGIPGSGKTTLAKKLMVLPYSVRVEADDFFTHPVSKEYNWSRKWLGLAHSYCLSQAAYRLKHGQDVIVSNTNLSWWEIEKYVDLAALAKCNVSIINCLGKFQNEHNVSEEKVRKMEIEFHTLQLPQLIDNMAVYSGLNWSVYNYSPFTDVHDEIVLELIYEKQR